LASVWYHVMFLAVEAETSAPSTSDVRKGPAGNRALRAAASRGA